MNDKIILFVVSAYAISISIYSINLNNNYVDLQQKLDDIFRVNQELIAKSWGYDSVQKAKEKNDQVKDLLSINQKRNENIAVSIVKELPEVKEWLKLFPNNKSALGGTPVVEFDHMNDSLYVVHAYEDFPSHTATLNWFEVNIETKEVKPEIY